VNNITGAPNKLEGGKYSREVYDKKAPELDKKAPELAFVTIITAVYNGAKNYRKND
jgi:hypothetical protein